MKRERVPLRERVFWVSLQDGFAVCSRCGQRRDLRLQLQLPTAVAERALYEFAKIHQRCFYRPEAKS